MRLRVRIAQIVTRMFVPLCRGGCRQPVTRCSCSWLPPLPDELHPPDEE